MEKTRKSQPASGGKHATGPAKKLRILSIGAHPADVVDQSGGVIPASAGNVFPSIVHGFDKSIPIPRAPDVSLSWKVGSFD